MKVIIYKGRLDDVIKEMKEDIENEKTKDMASNNEYKD